MADGGSGGGGGRSSPGHHSGEGRNILPSGQGHSGHDVFFAAVQMTRMPMCLSDPSTPDNPLVFVNRAFLEMTGYEEAEVIGRNCRFLQGPHTDPGMVRRIARALEAREDLAIELFNYRRDGTGFWNALYISPVFDRQGKLIYHFASQMDVTRRREAESMLRQSQRMETLGAMASGVAHEFNNLMTIAVASVEQASARAVDERQRTQLERADWAARRAGRLTQQMLSFARRQFHDDQLTDLSERVRELDSILGQMTGPGIEIAMRLAPEKLPVRLDTGQFELALINLARNAADAMPDGGTLTLATRLLPGGAAPLVELEVADTGEGMPAEVMRRATEPFFTTKARGRGTGLGLSMVQGFAEQSGGALTIESTPGQGATLRLRFPLHSR